MSQQFKLTKLQLDENLKEEFRNAAATMAVANPVTNKVYMQHSGNFEHFPVFNDESHFVVDVNAFNSYIKGKDEGRLSDSEYQDKINYDIWNSEYGWDEKAKLWYGHLKQNGMNNASAVAGDMQGLKPADVAGLEVSIVEATIYGMEVRNRVAQNAIRKVPVAGTKREFLSQTAPMTINRKIDFTAEIPMQSVPLSIASLNLDCDAAHFAIYDHTKWRPLAVDPLRINLEAMAQGFIQDEADQNVAFLSDTAITAIASEDFGDVTKNPYISFERLFKVINDNRGVVSKIMMHSLSRAVMRGNPAVKTAGDTSKSELGQANVTSGGIFVDGITHYFDPGFSTTMLTAWDDGFVEHNVGPTGTVNYRQDNRFREGYIRFLWGKRNIVDFTKIRRLTGINIIVP